MAPWRRLKDHSTHCQRILHAESMELPRSKLWCSTPLKLAVMQRWKLRLLDAWSFCLASGWANLFVDSSSANTAPLASQVVVAGTTAAPTGEVFASTNDNNNEVLNWTEQHKTLHKTVVTITEPVKTLCFFLLRTAIIHFSFIHSFIYSFIHSFHSFIHSFFHFHWTNWDTPAPSGDMYPAGIQQGTR